MVHIVVVTHGGLAKELANTVQLIVGTQEKLDAVCLELHEGIEDLKKKIMTVIHPETVSADGYLILVDMFGGTPSNVSLELSQSFPIRVVTGVNLPMLLEALTHRSMLDLTGLADLVHKKGRQSIFDANELLNPKGNREE
jgi:PTS system mannose-specific IIA component